MCPGRNERQRMVFGYGLIETGLCDVFIVINVHLDGEV